MNEEDVKVKVVLPLLSEMGFSVEDLRFEEYTQSDLTDGARFFSDIVAFRGEEALLLVEVKRPSVDILGPAGDKSVTQALKYARTRLPQPPIALVTNGIDVVLIDVQAGEAVGTETERADSLSEMARHVQRILERINAKREGFVHSLGGVAVEEIVSAAANQRRVTTRIVSGSDRLGARIVDRKYVPRLLVRRRAAEAGLRAFLRGEWTTFAVVGEAGFGKTNLVFDLASRCGTDEASFLFLADEIEGSVSAEIGRCVGIPIAGVSQLLQLANRLQKKDRRILIWLDALNESTYNRHDLSVELSRLARGFQSTPHKLIVSCRTLDWEFWTRGGKGALTRFGRSVLPQPSGRGAGRGFILDRWNDDELDDAWLRYKDAFSLSGNLSQRMREMCREPFMLRLVSEVYRSGRPLPDYVEPIDLFRRYFVEKFPVSAMRREVSRALWWIAGAMLKGGVPRVHYGNLPQAIAEAVNPLLDENVIVYQSNGSIGFHFELFLEYVLAEYVESRVTEGACTEREAMADLVKADLLNAPGAVENLLIKWQDRDSLLLWFAEALRPLDDRWKVIAASAMRKTSTPVADWEIVLKRLAADSNPVVRGYVSAALKPFVIANGIEPVDRLAASPEWTARESAAAAFGTLSVGEPVRGHIFRRLSGLAADFHWRVRRAVGYALQPHFCEGAWPNDLVSQLLEDWKSRYTLVVALSDIGTELAEEVVATLGYLANDEHPQARWGVAHYAARALGIGALSVLTELSRDPDPWVRKKVCSVAIDQVAIGREEYLPLIASLARDADLGVRVQVARDLAKVPGDDSVTILHEAISNDDDSAFAAAFTLAHDVPTPNAEALSQVSQPENAWVMVLRERIARKDIELLPSPFGEVKDYISRRTEYNGRADPYMDVVDTMCGLIVGSEDLILREGHGMRPLVESLCSDPDEAVRWALVVYLADHARGLVETGLVEDTLATLSQDPHWWVRREVAHAVRTMLEGGAGGGWEATLLDSLVSAEVARERPGSDEVLHFAGHY